MADKRPRIIVDAGRKFKREHRVSMRFPLSLMAKLKTKQAEVYTNQFLKVSVNDIIIEAILSHYGWEDLAKDYEWMKENPKAEDVSAEEIPTGYCTKQALNKIKNQAIADTGIKFSRRRRADG